MKKLTFILLLLISFYPAGFAQESPVNTGLGFGFQLNQYHRDFGYGLNITSPHFINEKVAVRLRGSFMYFEHVKKEEITWSSYTNISLGLAGAGGQITEKIRLYGEGGLIGLLPSGEFSKEELVIGGYGLFGFEFFMQKNFNYFIEIGGVGTGARADKIALKPIYSNGLSISTGLRAYLQ